MLKRLIILCLVAALAGTAAAAAAGARERCLGDHEIDAGMRIAACDTILESSSLPEPDQGVAYANRGSAHLNKEEYVLAVNDYDQAIKLRPGDANVLQGRCLARAVLKRDLDLALADCNEALQLQPNDARVLGYRALVYLRLGLNETAIVDYSAALEVKAQSAEYLYGRGQAKLRSGDAEGGAADIAAAKAITPKIAENFARLERDDGTWTWAAFIEYWRSVMRAIY